jgi:hypothetical protein
VLADDGVPADCGKCRHIQSIAHVAPAAGDGLFAAHLAGVAIDWCDTDESGETSTVELPEFG